MATSVSRPSSSGSKSTSQIHETSRPSAIASLSAITATLGAAPSTIVRTASFAPAGFLIRSIRSAPVADRDPLEPPERGREPPEARDDLVERHPERERERRCGERVVDVVEPRQRQLDPRLARGRDERERAAVEPVQLDLTRRRRRAAAARGRSSGSDSRRGGRGRRRRSRTACRSAGSTSSRPRAAARAGRAAGRRGRR